MDVFGTVAKTLMDVDRETPLKDSLDDAVGAVATTGMRFNSQ